VAAECHELAREKLAVLTDLVRRRRKQPVSYGFN